MVMLKQFKDSTGLDAGLLNNADPGSGTGAGDTAGGGGAQLYGGGGGGGGDGNGELPVREEDETTDSGWIKIARESDEFTVSAMGEEVRFGVNGRWSTTQTLTGNCTCDTTTFGGDPAPNIRKRCEKRVVEDPLPSNQPLSVLTLVETHTDVQDVPSYSFIESVVPTGMKYAVSTSDICDGTAAHPDGGIDLSQVGVWSTDGVLYGEIHYDVGQPADVFSRVIRLRNMSVSNSIFVQLFLPSFLQVKLETTEFVIQPLTTIDVAIGIRDTGAISAVLLKNPANKQQEWIYVYVDVLDVTDPVLVLDN